MVIVSRRARSPIGIDVGSRNVKAVQLCTSDTGHHEIAALSVIPRRHAVAETSLEEASALRRLLGRQGFRGNRVVLAADDRKLLRAVFELPGQLAGAAVAQIARMELARAHAVAPDSMETICWDPVRGAKPQSTAQAFALGYPHDAANLLLNVFEKVGFNICAVDARSSAVARACRSLTLKSPAITAILDLGWTSTRLLFACGKTVVYERLSVGDSISTIAAGLGDKFDVSEQSAYKVLMSVGLAGSDASGVLDSRSAELIQTITENHFNRMKRELKPPLAQISRQRCSGRAERMLLVGAGAMMPGISEYLKEGLGLDVLAAAPVDLLPGPDYVQARARDATLTASCGLAMFEMD